MRTMKVEFSPLLRLAITTPSKAWVRLRFAFDHVHADDHGVAGSEIGDGLAQTGDFFFFKNCRSDSFCFLFLYGSLFLLVLCQ